MNFLSLVNLQDVTKRNKIGGGKFGVLLNTPLMNAHCIPQYQTFISPVRIASKKVIFTKKTEAVL